MTDIKTTQQVFNLVFRDQDGGVLDTLASEQTILGLVLDEDSGRLKVQVAGGIGRAGQKLGSWSEDYTYNPGDIVNYDGQLYKCILSGSGDPPATSTTCWSPYSDGAIGEKYVRATWYQEISSSTGQTGAIGLPPDNPSAEFVFNEWPDGIDAVVCGLDADRRPDETTVFTAGGDLVYVPASGGLSGDGAYTLSGVPAALPCAFIYRYRCKLRDFDDHYALKGCDFEQGLELENLLGTSGQITVTNNSDNTLTLSIPDPAMVGDLALASGKALSLETVKALNSNGLDLTEATGGYGLTIRDDGRLEAKGAAYPSYLNKTISSNTTIYCGLTDGDHIGDNALPQALTSLLDYRIPPDVTVTIELSNDVFGAVTPLSTIYLTHPDISRIVIQGNIDNAASFEISAAENAPDVENHYIHVPAGNYGPGDFVPGGSHRPFIVHVVGSTGNDGAYRVIDATMSGADIRLEMEPGTVLNTAKNGTLYLLPSNQCQLLFGNNNGISHESIGTLAMAGLYIYGPASNRNGITLVGSGRLLTLSKCIINGWNVGLNLARASYADCSASAYNANNVIMPNNSGYYAQLAATLEANYSVVSGAPGGAFTGIENGNIRCPYAVATRNNAGFSAMMSQINAIRAVSMHNTTGCLAYNMSAIRVYGMRHYGNTANTNPAGTPPQMSADGGWILV